MKIKTASLPYEQVLALPAEVHKPPKKPNLFFRTLLKVASAPDLLNTRFHCRKIGMEKLKKDEPCLILMNHSSFIDLEIAASVLFPRPFQIVCTSDGFVGKNWLMRQLGCIPTKKFVSDPTLVRDMLYAVRENRCSILMYPEASYSFDGTATPLPDSLGYCLKKLGVPVIFIQTYGAFARDPLYNNLQKRKVQVSADITYLLSPAEIQSMSTAELNECLQKAFSFDNFRWQKENHISVREPFRADYLNRVLYKCPHCLSEGEMLGRETSLQCSVCGKLYTMTELGEMEAADGHTEFSHVPDWFAWERSCVRREIENGTYRLDIPVDICMLVNTDRLYRVGTGRLIHDSSGFTLSGCDGKLSYTQKPTASYSLYADYYWYEMGDVICIGDSRALYYCFPQSSADVVAKARLAAEELYKITRPNRKIRENAAVKKN